MDKNDIKVPESRSNTEHIEGSAPSWSTEAERKLVLKIGIHILPMLTIMYILNYTF
jgi:hypothetical protein